jgi:hypothetical protein
MRFTEVPHWGIFAEVLSPSYILTLVQILIDFSYRSVCRPVRRRVRISLRVVRGDGKGTQ